MVCACKDFIEDDKEEILIPYTSLRNDTSPEVMKHNDSSTFSPSNIKEIMFQLENNSILKNINNAKDHFLKMSLVDILINNNDRNEDNWGVLKNKSANSFSISPIYDCGNSFYGKTSDEKIENILKIEERMISSSTNTITSYENDSGEILFSKDLLKEKFMLSIRKEMSTVIHENFSKIEKMINDIPESFNGVEIISKSRKEYYIKSMKIRLDMLID